MTNGLEKAQINKNHGSKQVLQIKVMSQLNELHDKGKGNKTHVLGVKF